MKIVVALGGNALLDFGQKPTFEVQYRNALRMARNMRPLLAKKETSIIITHGNGPQVGDELLRNKFAKKEIPELPLPALNAETQALIGTILELALKHELARMKVDRAVVALLTHVVVDRSDDAFTKPTKPVGPFYTRAQLESELRKEHFSFVKGKNGYRRVVASPRPLRIVEIEPIRELVDRKAVVIAAGGGGIPVVGKNGSYKGIDAVIDKDLTAQLLANSLDADVLVILTNVNGVYRDHNMKHQIRRIKARELEEMLDEFEEGTMLPKLLACARFVEKGGKKAYIGSLFKLDAILAGKSGTEIVR